MLEKESMIIIVGATASGKSGLAEEVAKKYNGFIINSDVSQMYQAYSVGTAKPEDKPERGSLFDVLKSDEDFSVVKYRYLVEEELKKNNCEKIPIVVGGSFFYIKELFFKQEDQPSSREFISDEIVDSIKSIDLFSLGADELFDILLKIDQVRANKIGRFDKYRLWRALEIIKKWKVLPSSLSSSFFPIVNRILIIAITPKKEYLEKRIMKRLELMLADGVGPWVSEVHSLRGTIWEDFAKKKGFLGYKELFEWVGQGADLGTLDLVKQKIYLETRRYAKRQNCFWRGLQKQLLEKAESSEDFFLKIIEVEDTENMDSLMMSLDDSVGWLNFERKERK